MAVIRKIVGLRSLQHLLRAGAPVSSKVGVRFCQQAAIENQTDQPYSGSLYPGQYQTNEMKLKKGTWPYNEGIYTRLPDHFKQRYIERYTTQPIPVHYRPDERKYKVDAYGTRTKVRNIPIPLKFPKQADEGLWGGEGIIQGYYRKNDDRMKPRWPYITKPMLIRRVFYSEILDQWMAITCTHRTLDLVDESEGFDNYILKTHEVDLQSKLGMILKREMIKTLNNKSMYPNDAEKREAIYKKYQHLTIPNEEAEWLGLSLEEAVEKQNELENSFQTNTPLKEIYAREMIDEIHELADSEEEQKSASWMSKLNPFVKQEDSEKK